MAAYMQNVMHTYDERKPLIGARTHFGTIGKKVYFSYESLLPRLADAILFLTYYFIKISCNLRGL